jgi:copper chaperone CopZ
MAAVRSALLGVNGVTRAQVSLETREAVATYDPRATNVDALIAAVNAVKEPFPFFATVKGPPPAGASAR